MEKNTENNSSTDHTNYNQCCANHKPSGNFITRFIGDIFKVIVGFFRTILVYGMAFILIISLVSVLAAGNLSEKNTKKSFEIPNDKVIMNTGGEDKIIYSKLYGTIVSSSQESLFSGSGESITPDMVFDILTDVKNDPKVKAIIFEVNSPGGSPVASDQIFEFVSNFRQETSIPVVFLLSDLAASGGYYIANSGDFIVANPSTITGSIGVILSSYNLSGLYEKLGVQKNTFKQGEFKDILNDSRDITKEEKAILDSISADAYELFLKRVSEGRKEVLSPEEVKILANGRIYSGKQAKEAKLVDSLGNLDEAIYQAKSLANLDKYVVIEYSKGSLFNDFLQELSTKTGIFSLFSGFDLRSKLQLWS